jgi:hypothetical protein
VVTCADGAYAAAVQPPRGARVPFIDPPAESDLYAADEAVHGFVPNFTRLFAHRPEVYRAGRD